MNSKGQRQDESISETVFESGYYFDMKNCSVEWKEGKKKKKALIFFPILCFLIIKIILS